MLITVGQFFVMLCKPFFMTHLYVKWKRNEHNLTQFDPFLEAQHKYVQLKVTF